MPDKIDMERLEELAVELMEAGAVTARLMAESRGPVGLAFLLQNPEDERIRKLLDRTDLAVKLSDQAVETLESLKKIQGDNRRLKKLSSVDDRTGLYNHRYFHERIRVEMQRVNRTESPCSLIMMDLDHFKEVNDRFGHQAGDELLARVGDILRKGIRAVDVGVRYGGDEFAVILPDTDLREAAGLAERLRNRFHGDKLTSDYGVTGSFGLAAHHYYDQETPEALIERADQALYQAKKEGGDKVWYFERDLKKARHTEVSVSERDDLFSALLEAGEPEG